MCEAVLTSLRLHFTDTPSPHIRASLSSPAADRLVLLSMFDALYWIPTFAGKKNYFVRCVSLLIRLGAQDEHLGNFCQLVIFSCPCPSSALTARYSAWDIKPVEVTLLCLNIRMWDNKAADSWKDTSHSLILTVPLPWWSISNFPCSLTRKTTPDSMKNLAFHSLLWWKMINILPLLTTSLKHFYLKDLENVLFYLGSGRVKRNSVPSILFLTWYTDNFISPRPYFHTLVLLDEVFKRDCYMEFVWVWWLSCFLLVLYGLHTNFEVLLQESIV